MGKLAKNGYFDCYAAPVEVLQTLEEDADPVELLQTLDAFDQDAPPQDEPLGPPPQDVLAPQDAEYVEFDPDEFPDTPDWNEPEFQWESGYSSEELEEDPDAEVRWEHRADIVLSYDGLLVAYLEAGGTMEEMAAFAESDIEWGA